LTLSPTEGQASLRQKIYGQLDFPLALQARRKPPGKPGGSLRFGALGACLSNRGGRFRLEFDSGKAAIRSRLSFATYRTAYR
jgi:hypothetical protein